MSTLPNEVSDVICNEIMLYNFNRSNKRNIYNLVTEIDIYESLTNNTLCADIGISEGIELLNNFPMNGEEFIEFKIQTPSRKEITYSFFVESIERITSSDNSMLKNYILRCVTEDYLTNSYKLYSKRYSDLGYDEALTQVIQVDLGSNKKIQTETTMGKFDYTVNNVRPFQVIDLIKERAVSAEENLSSLFFFYEDNEQYRFLTLEKLIKDRRDNANNFVFVYDTSNRASNFEEVVNIRNILSYTTSNQGSSIDKVRSGRMANQVRQFDILTGAYYDKYEYNNTVDSSSFEKTDDDIDFNSDDFNSTVTSSPGRYSMVFKDGTRPEMKHNSTLHYKRPFQEKISQYSITIRVYGDTSLLIGDMVKLNIPEITGVTVQPKQQEIFSNNYIVFSQRHMLRKRKNDGRFSHFMSLDLRKPNLHKKGIA